MRDYIRSGQRGNRATNRYHTMQSAAKQIQIKIWEGELVGEDRLTYIRLPSNSDCLEMNEYFSGQATVRKQRMIPSFEQNDQLQAMRSVSGEPRDRSCRSSRNGELDVVRRKSQPKKTFKQSAPTIFLSSERVSNKKGRKNEIFDDIDRIVEFVFYFAYNNFSMQHPSVKKNKKTGVFDYFSQSETNKTLLKKFVQILKEKVKARKEAEAKEKETPCCDKDINKHRPSVFKQYKLPSPRRSQFYQERQLLSSSSPGLNPKNNQGLFRNKVSLMGSDRSDGSQSEGESPT